MAEVTFQGNAVTTSGSLPAVGDKAPDFTVVAGDLSDRNLSDFSGKNLVINIFPSVDTGVCAQSVRTFNEKASSLDNTVVLCVSRDLPFALDRFCAAEGLENVETASDFRHGFGEAFGIEQVSGPLTGLLARAVVVIDPQGEVTYTQLVPEIGEEPDYDKALAALS
ncbi:thiol peroxidase [Corynebacterium glucuronolyticum]|uniref:thiol peroxidase n=1 Tax=Corynebacterium glucuronolyticum TaxID=39791 RepID=UPI00191D87D2|nr:thiol peroxidase [Corynebacterium glucuronolyticum]QQU87405.1 thiol peroxidase [Corynebacterium glucuronolyticum]